MPGTWPEIWLDGRTWKYVQGAHQMSVHILSKSWTILYLMGSSTPRPLPDSFRPVRMIFKVGTGCSPFPLVCNPLFLEALMGWPAGWTDTASRVTEFAAWLRRMRWSLSSLLRARG